MEIVGRIQKGISAVSGDYLSTRIAVEYDETETDVETIRTWLAEAGYETEE